MSTQQTIADLAHSISRSKDTEMYQHRSTMQVFQTIKQSNGSFELIILNDGRWHSEGIMSIEEVINMLTNPE
jgi:hypothetical protein